MMHDLVSFPGARISLTSIHAVSDEIENGEPTGTVYVDYGHGSRLGFEGSVDDVMALIDAYCAAANG